MNHSVLLIDGIYESKYNLLRLSAVKMELIYAFSGDTNALLRFAIWHETIRYRYFQHS